jgi:hypothetical protein
MGGLRPLDQSELYRQAEALHQTYAAAELNCAERVFLIMHRLLETDIPAEAVCLMTGFGGGVGGARDNLSRAITVSYTTHPPHAAVTYGGLGCWQ